METQLAEQTSVVASSAAPNATSRNGASTFSVAALKRPEWLVVVGLGIGIFADLLIYGKPIGISYPIIVTVLVAALLIFARAEGSKITLSNLWVGAAAVALAVMTFVRAAPFLEFLNFAGSIALLILFLRGLKTRPLYSLNLGEYILELVKTPLIGAFVPFPVLLRSAQNIKHRGYLQNGNLQRVLLGLLIAVPILFVFTILFAAADLIFGNIVDNVFKFLRIDNLFGHIILSLIMSWLALAGLGFALSRPDDSGDVLPASERASHKYRFLGMIESGIVLFSVNALFLLFVGIQFAALFGGQAFIEAQGLTYSEYARRGFFELAAVAVMSQSLILALDFLTKRESARQHTLFLAGSTTLVIMTVIVLTSAFQRMTLYEAAFGFTRLRVFTHVFMVWMAVMLGAFLVMLYARRTYMFATGLLIGAVIYVLALNVLNPDAFIARQNIERFERAGEELDLFYLALLSEDALPVWAPLLHDDDLTDSVGPLLHAKLNPLDVRQRNWGWPSYHVSKDRAYTLLDGERELIESYEPEYLYRSYYDSSEYNAYR